MGTWKLKEREDKGTKENVDAERARKKELQTQSLTKS